MKNQLLFLVFGLAVAVASSGAFAVEVTLLGPSQMDRTKGAPNFYRETFPAMAGEATLVVVNGGASRKSRVSSAVITINGQTAVSPNDLSKKVDRIELELPVLESNTIEVTLRSKPGSYLTVSLVQDIPVELEAGMPGLGLESPNRLLLALPVKNIGAVTAFDVQVTSAALEVAGSPTPFTLPTALGDIGGGGSSVFEAGFPSNDLGSGQEYLLTVAGTYLVGGGGLTLDYAFEKTLLIPQRAPGSATLNTASVVGKFVTGAPFPPENPGPVEIPEGYNEEEVPPIPTGQLRGTLSPENTLTGFSPPTPAPAKRGRASTATTAPLKASDPVLFFHSNQFATSTGTWLDLSGASCEDVVIGSYNGPVSFSTDGGATYTQLIATSVFPNRDANGDLIDGGFCCDQVIQYVPKIDRFIWLMQFRRAVLPGDDPDEPSGPNRYRLAAASPADVINSGGTAWTFWDLTSGLFGFGNNWMDYPDLAVGENYLYFSADVLGGGGLFVGRIPLVDIAAAGVINIDFTNPADSSVAWGAHLVQNVGDTAYWAGHNTNSQLRLFSLPEGGNVYYWNDININSWPNEDYESITPNGENWLGFRFPGSAVIGGTKLSITHFPPDNPSGEFDEVWLAWSAARGGGFAQPHVQVIKIDTWDNSIVSQRQLWNADVAIAYPAMAANRQSEVGMALAFGGGTSHSNFSVGIFGEPVFFYPALADASAGRFADYFGVRPHAPINGLYSAFGVRYTLTDPNLSPLCRSCSLDWDTRCREDADCQPSNGVCTGNCSTNAHYILFGRESAIEEPPPPPK